MKYRVAGGVNGWSAECSIFPNGRGMRGEERTTEGTSPVCSRREKIGGVQSKEMSLLLCS